MKKERNLEERVEQALKQIAKQECITVEEVKQEIQTAMDLAVKELGSESQSFWAGEKATGRNPTPEELVMYCVNKISKHN